jgi:DUF4097 and DUF4098 domain-containing protein YvlB
MRNPGRKRLETIVEDQTMNLQNHSRNHRLIVALLATGLAGNVLLAKDQFTEELHQTYPFSADGRISLDNVNGSVRITTWDRAEVKLDAVKRAKRKEDLETVKIEIEAKSDRLRVHTKLPESKDRIGRRRDNSTSVDYTLKVPASARLDTVSSVNGAVDIEGVRGEVEASTVNGSLHARGLAARTELSSVNGGVKAAFGSLDGVPSVSLKTVNGGVELELPPGANADLSASTVNGGISGDVPVKKNWPIGREVKARLGGGGTKIQVSSVNGGVRVRAPQSAERN